MINVDNRSIAVIQVGEHKIFDRYKNYDIYYYEKEIPEKELVTEIIDLQEFYDGIIIQLPLPPHISQMAIVLAIDPIKDIGGLRAAALYDPVEGSEEECHKIIGFMELS